MSDLGLAQDEEEGWVLWDASRQLRNLASYPDDHWKLSLIPYEDLTPEPLALPPRQPDAGYVRPPIAEQTFVPDAY